MKLNNLEIEQDDLIYSITSQFTREELLSLILEIEDRVDDSDFTFEIIRALLRSLECYVSQGVY